jgi:predicted AAA+ superfamily ATPase
MQVLAGPRQVGKTTLIRQVLEGLHFPNHYASADEPTLKDSSWLEQQWEIGRLRGKEGQALLVLDEIQKVQKWPDLVKTLWDQDTAARLPLKVVLLGSSPY